MAIELKVLDYWRDQPDDAVPQFATTGSAAVDLMAAISDTLILPPGCSELVPTGIAVHIADPNMAAMILPRSGLGAKVGLVLGNLVGLIDSDYQGEIFVSAWNRNFDNPVRITPRTRLAQMVFVPVVRPEFCVVDAFCASLRGARGFGSTGHV